MVRSVSLTHPILQPEMMQAEMMQTPSFKVGAHKEEGSGSGVCIGASHILRG